MEISEFDEVSENGDVVSDGNISGSAGTGGFVELGC
jgi:hypothetical protein